MLSPPSCLSSVASCRQFVYKLSSIRAVEVTYLIVQEPLVYFQSFLFLRTEGHSIHLTPSLAPCLTDRDTFLVALPNYAGNVMVFFVGEPLLNFLRNFASDSKECKRNCYPLHSTSSSPHRTLREEDKKNGDRKLGPASENRSGVFIVLTALYMHVCVFSLSQDR